ncbi:MAG: hypothetical protein GQ567_06330 [Methanosarcinales archaeon]|nr:hypothetical protein [Methanosarcinales archaeon]
MPEPPTLRCECGALTVPTTLNRYGRDVSGSQCPVCGKIYVNADEFNRALESWVAKQCCRSDKPC